MNSTSSNYKYLVPKPGSCYKQLFVKDRWVSARTLYGMYVNEEEPMTLEEIATAYDVPLEAVHEAIAYCESNPPEIAEDFARERANVKDAGTKSILTASISRNYKYLVPKPGSCYKQLFVKDRWVSARTLYGMYVRDRAPMNIEEIAADYNLPLEAVYEAIAYCESNPPEIVEDFAREEANVRAAGRDKPPVITEIKTPNSNGPIG